MTFRSSFTYADVSLTLVISLG